MGAIGLLGLSRSRRAAGLPVLGAAIVVVLVVDPWLARSFGFALSSLATLGLLLFTRPWGDAIGAAAARPPAPASAPPWRSRWRPRRWRPRSSCCCRARSASSASSPTCSPRRSCRWPPSPGSPRPSPPWSGPGAPRSSRGRGWCRRRSSPRSPGGSPRCPVARCPGPTAPRVPCSSLPSPSRCCSPAARWPPRAAAHPVLGPRRRAGPRRRHGPDPHGHLAARRAGGSWPATSVRATRSCSRSGPHRPSSSTPGPTRRWSTAA